MSFPFTISFKKKPAAQITAENKPAALRYIEEKIREKKANRIVVTLSKVQYKGSTSYWTGALFKAIDGGAFNFVNNNGNDYLVYKIRMNELVIVTLLMGCVIAIVSQKIWIGIGAFLWLGGLNWVIAVIRHEALAAELAFGIDELNGVQEKHIINLKKSNTGCN